jgi:hypothetical protein
LWCAEAIESGSIELRKMGAEAASWLPIDSATTMDNPLLRVTSADRERVIREASERSREDLRKRLWSRGLFAEISASRDDPNDWVLQTYALGRALAAIGDDDDLQQLESMSRDRSMPPNVRYWLGLVGRDLEKQWKKTTDQWPQSSNPWRHARERFDEGVVTFDGTRHPASVALWRRRRQTPDHRGSWGGAATLTADDLPAMFVSTTESATLDLPGRPSAAIAVVESTFVMGRERRFVFLGNGPYPDRSAAYLVAEHESSMSADNMILLEFEPSDYTEAKDVVFSFLGEINKGYRQPVLRSGPDAATVALDLGKIGLPLVAGLIALWLGKGKTVKVKHRGDTLDLRNVSEDSARKMLQQFLEHREGDTK